MKKTFLVLLVLSVAFSAFAAGSAEAKQEKVVIKWGSVHATNSVTTQLMDRVIANVNKKTEGRVEIQGYPNGSIGSSRDLVEGIQAGMVDMCTEGPAQFAAWIKLAPISEAPYIWRDVDHLSRALNGGFGELINKEFEKVNVKMIGSIYYGTRQLSTTRKPVYSVDDVAGMKIRVPESTLYLEMIKSWGARPTPINFNELYLSLQQNVVGGQENPLTTFDGSKFYEVQKYVNLTNHIICPNMIFINMDVWNKISEGDQQIIMDAMKEGIKWHDEKVVQAELDLLESLKAKGVTIVETDVESFRAVTAPWIKEMFADDWGADTWDYIQSL